MVFRPPTWSEPSAYYVIPKKNLLRSCLAYKPLVPGLPLGAIGVWFAWDGRVSRVEGAILVALYLLYLDLIWRAERKPPMIGEVSGIAEAREAAAADRPARGGRDLILVLAGVAAMTGGASLLVEAVQQIRSVEATRGAPRTDAGRICYQVRDGCARVVSVSAWHIRSGGRRSGRLVCLRCHDNAPRWRVRASADPDRRYDPTRSVIIMIGSLGRRSRLCR